MPIETELENIITGKSKLLYEENDLFVYGTSNYLRNVFLIESSHKGKVISQFRTLFKIIQSKTDSPGEPMMNIIALYNNTWKVLIFPRAKHRPLQYFLEDENRMLISPAAVDFGGQLITPREEDFNKITKDNIKDIFTQTTISEDLFERIGEEYSASAARKKV